LREIARQHGLDHSLVQTWRDNYRQHGVVGLRKKYTHRSAAFKLQVLDTMWRDGLSRRHTQHGGDILWAMHRFPWYLSVGNVISGLLHE